MYLSYRFKITCILFIVCSSSVYADIKLEKMEESWKDGQYGSVIPKLIDYRETKSHPGLMLLVDYMLGTSMCRVPAYQTDGFELLTLIPYIYRHLSRHNYSIVHNEARDCKDKVHKISRLSYSPPGVYGKGGRERVSIEKRSLTEKKFIDRIKGYSNRLYEIEKELPLDLESRVKKLAGIDYNTAVHGHFIIVGTQPKSDLVKTGKMLEGTLSSFMKQFNLEAPKYYTTIYLFSTANKMVSFASINHEVNIPPTMWGYTFAYDSSIVIRTSGGMGTIGHEILHTLLNHNFPESPPWLNEGYSALFEEFSLKNDKIAGDYKIVGTFRTNHWRIKYLYKYPSRRPSISKLIAMDWREFDAPDMFSSETAHINHTTAKFFALYLQNKKHRLVEVFHAFQNKDFRKDPGSIVTKYKKLLEETLDKTPIDKIEKDFQKWLDTELGSNSSQPLTE